jgi:hypothetical protein
MTATETMPREAVQCPRPINFLAMNSATRAIFDFDWRIRDFVLQKITPHRFTIPVYFKIGESKRMMSVSHLTFRHYNTDKAKWRDRQWMRLSIGLKKDGTYPFGAKIAVGSAQVNDPVAALLMKTQWAYEYEDVTFNTREEVVIYSLGNLLFKAMRRMKLIPGRASKVGQAKFGLGWLKEYREWIKIEAEELRKAEK